MKSPQNKSSYRRGYEDGRAVRTANPRGFDENLYREGYRQGLADANQSIEIKRMPTFRN
jgi:hypothetical protein